MSKTKLGKENNSLALRKVIHYLLHRASCRLEVELGIGYVAQEFRTDSREILPR